MMILVMEMAIGDGSDINIAYDAINDFVLNHLKIIALICIPMFMT